MAKTDDLPAMEGPGVAQKKIIALDNAVEKWRDIVEKRMTLTKQECEARDRVMAIMHEKGVEKYRYRVSDDEEKVLVLVPGKEKVKLKALEEETATDETKTPTINSP